ncbi:unnamed protein product [Heligmosomoides polygyrus]|uniref:receptor protein-tyrosine kinase n=1 Tax=Heligmosomoides polygyrus TaxID=6339 RepID=A0A183FGH5_HELPZ|nr:unnamed protein product [Heligmosomoides polygyrus]
MKGVLRIPGRVPVKVAVKMAKKDAGNIEKIKEILKEARIMRNFIHPNVVRIFGVAVQKEPLLIVMELMSAGDLRSFLRSQPSTPGKKLQWISEAAYGLEYLHSKRCIHRDIAARNCLLTSKHRLKLSDFGLSRIGETYRMATARKMPIKWIPPEIIRNNMFSLKSDVWSYGILVWEIMANGATPYNALPNAKVRELILAGEKNVFPKGSDPEVVQFVETRCWLMDPSKRCTMSEVMILQ